jgi:hypothetical protein
MAFYQSELKEDGEKVTREITCHGRRSLYKTVLEHVPADIFDDYCLDTVLDALMGNARIVRRETLHPSGRELIWYENGRSDR